MAQPARLPAPEESSADKMTFLEHLDELRRRIIFAILSLAVAFVACFTFSTQIFDFLMGPMKMALPPGGELIAIAVPEIFVLHLKMSFFVAILVASPAWLTQIWLFIAPGLYANEKKFAVPFIFFGSAFFILGAVFSHYVVFPTAVNFLTTFGSEDIQVKPSVSQVFSFYARVILGTGAVFQIPTVVLLLARMGIVSAAFLWRNFKYAVLVIFIVAAVMTPPDVVTQILLAFPMVALYLFSIGVAWIVGRDRQKPDGKD
ncbi:MAG TPA: twin-arginine translocase subunit TatC [Vicinamibacteria bacterium]|nr:twin-arginine translocase subunit TatC [Vicinamibacteria bacterium]